jgi:hypothetical protein
MTGMYLTHEQREALTAAAQVGLADIEGIIALLRKYNPEAFHTAESLPQRVFFDQPVRNEPCRGFIRFAPKKAA